jgi:hypothetical protein
MNEPNRASDCRDCTAYGGLHTLYYSARPCKIDLIARVGRPCQMFTPRTLAQYAEDARRAQRGDHDPTK